MRRKKTRRSDKIETQLKLRQVPKQKKINRIYNRHVVTELRVEMYCLVNKPKLNMYKKNRM
jgi:hypothetical protein